MASDDLPLGGRASIRRRQKNTNARWGYVIILGLVLLAVIILYRSNTPYEPEVTKKTAKNTTVVPIPQPAKVAEPKVVERKDPQIVTPTTNAKPSHAPPLVYTGNEHWSKTVLKAGDNKTYPHIGQSITVHYTGSLSNGTVFDSSLSRGPFSTVIGVGQLIKGWDEGILSMSVGEKSNFTIFPEYGYGANGVPGAIPPNAVLFFQVELISIQ